MTMNNDLKGMGKDGVVLGRGEENHESLSRK
jgi:hypothetical protein